MTMPDKYFYTIGDVCQITSTKPHVLRYWESQFRLLRPARRYSGHRKYTKADLDLIQKIRYLIIDRKFTLAGAKKEIMRQIQSKSKPPAPEAGNNPPGILNTNALTELKRDLEDCLNILGPDPKQQELVGI